MKYLLALFLSLALSFPTVAQQQGLSIPPYPGSNVGSGTTSAVAGSQTYFMGTQGGLAATETGIPIPVSINTVARSFSCGVGFGVQVANSIVCTLRVGPNGATADTVVTCTINAGSS